MVAGATDFSGPTGRVRLILKLGPHSSSKLTLEVQGRPLRSSWFCSVLLLQRACHLTITSYLELNYNFVNSLVLGHYSSLVTIDVSGLGRKNRKMSYLDDLGYD